MSKQWWEESPQEFADGFTETTGTHHTGEQTPTQRRWTHEKLKTIRERGSIADLERLIAVAGLKRRFAHLATKPLTL